MSKSTTPRIYPKNPTPADMSKEWRVWFIYDGKMISRQGSLAECKTFAQRYARAKALVDLLQERLDRGWNPVTNTYPIKSLEELEKERLQSMSFVDALDYAYGKKIKDWSHKSAQDYRSIIKGLKASAPDLLVTEMKRRDYKELLEAVTNSPGSFNKYRSMLSGLISELVEWDIIEYNPIRDIKTKQEQKTFAHRPPTKDERVLIVNRLKQNPEYFRFVALVYGCGIRPKEISRIRIKHLHKQESIFRLSKEVTKTGNERDVIIPNWVMNLLAEMNLHNFTGETFLFSKNFLPGTKQLPVNKSHQEWKKLVKEGLGIDVNLYSLKKLSGDDMVKLQRQEGVMNLLQLPQMQFGHENKEMTETYVREHKEVLKEVIVKHMPEL
jgi:integrase